MQGKVFRKWFKNIIMMITESDKYNRILNSLRKSQPHLNSTDEIQREVIRRVSKTSDSKFGLSEIVDFLFGWVYIWWVRRSLIVASVIMVVIFVWQQGIIIKQINYLSRQTTIINGEKSIGPADVLEKRLLMFKLSDQKFSSRNITITGMEMKQLLDSVNDLQIKYKDLMKLIEEDPELKQYIENKLIENNRTKIKL